MVFPNKHDEDWYWPVEILYRNIEILFPMKEICKSCLLHEPWVDVFSYIFFLIWLITVAYAWSAFLCNTITYSRNISGVHGFPSLTVRYMPLRSRCFHLLKVTFFWQLNNLLVVILISLVSPKCSLNLNSCMMISCYVLTGNARRSYCLQDAEFSRLSIFRSEFLLKPKLHQEHSSVADTSNFYFLD